MTEAEWLAAVEPQALLDHYAHRASQRKLRLAAAASARVVWVHLTDRLSREAIETAERFADRTVDRHDFAVARERAVEAVLWAEEHTTGAALHAARAAQAVTLEDSGEAARDAVRHAGLAAGEGSGSILCAILRDVFGNPFNPVAFDPWWLGRDGEIKQLGRALYESHRFAELPALADALAGQGCRHAGILEHCRGAGPHVRGCWVLDLLTGRT
jgi:hypothetical protein